MNQSKRKHGLKSFLIIDLAFLGPKAYMLSNKPQIAVQDTENKEDEQTAEEMHETLHEATQRAQEVQSMVHMPDTYTEEGNHVMLKSGQDNNNVEELMRSAADKECGVSQSEIHFEPHSRWHLLSHFDLPEWLRGNPFLSHYHRPPMPSFGSCFKSIFKIHTETGNIWTHLIGFVAFVCITLYMFLRPVTSSSPFPRDWQEKLVFGSFFACGILCLGFSWIFHTVHCHSKMVSKVFRR